MQAYGALWAILGVGMLPVLRSHSIVDLPYFIGLAVVTIYVGAHRGLNSKQRQTISIEQVQRPFPSAAPSTTTQTGSSHLRSLLSALQGALAPVFASIALFGAYLLIKFLPQLDLQTFFNCYFWYADRRGGRLVPVYTCPTLSGGNKPLANQLLVLHPQVDWINSHHWHLGSAAAPAGDHRDPCDVTLRIASVVLSLLSTWLSSGSGL